MLKWQSETRTLLVNGLNKPIAGKTPVFVLFFGTGAAHNYFYLKKKNRLSVTARTGSAVDLS